MQLNALHQAVGSLKLGPDVESLMIDFDVMPLGSGIHTHEATVYNRESTAGFTSDLKLGIIVAAFTSRLPSTTAAVSFFEARQLFRNS